MGPRQELREWALDIEGAGVGEWDWGESSSLEGAQPTLCIPFVLSWHPHTSFLSKGSLCRLWLPTAL